MFHTINHQNGNDNLNTIVTNHGNSLGNHHIGFLAEPDLIPTKNMDENHHQYKVHSPHKDITFVQIALTQQWIQVIAPHIHKGKLESAGKQ